MQASQEEQLKQKLLEEQFVLLQGTVAEAEKIIQDAVAKLDDPLHIRCTSSPGQTPPLLCHNRDGLNRFKIKTWKLNK